MSPDARVGWLHLHVYLGFYLLLITQSTWFHPMPGLVFAWLRRLWLGARNSLHRRGGEPFIIEPKVLLLKLWSSPYYHHHNEKHHIHDHHQVGWGRAPDPDSGLLNPRDVDWQDSVFMWVQHFIACWHHHDRQQKQHHHHQYQKKCHYNASSDHYNHLPGGPQIWICITGCSSGSPHASSCLNDQCNMSPPNRGWYRGWNLRVFHLLAVTLKISTIENPNNKPNIKPKLLIKPYSD